MRWRLQLLFNSSQAFLQALYTRLAPLKTSLGPAQTFCGARLPTVRLLQLLLQAFLALAQFLFVRCPLFWEWKCSLLCHRSCSFGTSDTLLPGYSPSYWHKSVLIDKI